MVEDNTLPFLAQEQSKDPDLKDLIRITLYLVILQKLIILLPWQQKAQSQSSPLRGGRWGYFPGARTNIGGPEHLSMPM